MERYVITIEDDHRTVRLEDKELPSCDRTFTGPRALYDALGLLAEWRERDLARGE